MQNELEQKNKIVQNNNNTINYLRMLISQKDEELKKYKNNIFFNNGLFYNFGNTINVLFSTMDYAITKLKISCGLDELFESVLQKLYQRQPSLRQKKLSFIANGRLLLRDRTVKDNGLDNNSSIIIIQILENDENRNTFLSQNNYGLNNNIITYTPTNMETTTFTNTQNVNNLNPMGNAAPPILNQFLNFPQETTTVTDYTMNNIINNTNNADVMNNDDILNELGIDINSIFNENTLNNGINYPVNNTHIDFYFQE